MGTEDDVLVEVQQGDVVVVRGDVEVGVHHPLGDADRLLRRFRESRRVVDTEHNGQVDLLERISAANNDNLLFIKKQWKYVLYNEVQWLLLRVYNTFEHVHLILNGGRPPVWFHIPPSK